MLLKSLNLMTAISKDFRFLIKKIFLNEKKLLKKRIISLLLQKGYKGNFIIPLPNIKILESKKLL